jgi:hypothetical protein
MLRSFSFCLVNCFITFSTVNVFAVVCNGNWEMLSEACVTRNLNSMDYTYRYFSKCLEYCSVWKHNWKLNNCTSVTVLFCMFFLYVSLKCAFCFLMNPCKCLHIYNNFATCHARYTIYNVWGFTKAYETEFIVFVSLRCLDIFCTSGQSSAWGTGGSYKGPNLVSKAGGETPVCCAWPRTDIHGCWARCIV